MASRLATWGAVAALLLGAAPAFGQSKSNGKTAGDVTLIGCVELEKDYRARMDAKKGGPAASGAGQGNEFVLVSAKPEQAQTRREAVATAGQSGDYMLTGKTERELKSAVGRQIEVVGTVAPFEVHESAKDSRDRLPQLVISTWHPVNDYCPGR
jgi:hypothetical protein